MANLNTVTLAGNLTRDPELRMAGQSEVAVLNLAVNHNKRKGEEWIQETTFLEIECWNSLETIRRLSKGWPVLVEGRLAMDSWEDRNTGQKRSKLKIAGRRVQSLRPLSDRFATNQQQPPQGPPPGYQPHPQQGPNTQFQQPQRPPQQPQPPPQPPQGGYAPPPPPQQRPPVQQQPPPPVHDVGNEEIDDIPF